jgi:hypothetical protein
LSVHRPHSRWNCGECRNPWPCEVSKAELLARFDGVVGALLAEMTAQYHRAAVVLTDTASTEIYIRFTAWIPGMEPEPWPFHAAVPWGDQ